MTHRMNNSYKALLPVVVLEQMIEFKEKEMLVFSKLTVLALHKFVLCLS